MCVSFWTCCVAAGQTYEVLDPTGVRTTLLEVQADSIQIIDRTAGRLLYLREPRFDSLNGQYAGYFHPALNRVLRFPRIGAGAIWMADLDDLAPRFQPMTGTLRRLSGSPHHPIANPRGYFPGGFGQRGFGQNGFGAAFRFGVPIVVPPSIILPTPIITPPPVFGAFPMGALQPHPAPVQSVLIDSQTVPGPVLEPVELGLRNGGPSEIIVTIVDTLNRGAPRQIRIRPGEVVREQFNRQSTDQQIDTYRVASPNGDFGTKRVTVPIPPEVQYEIIVHQWQIQSIAIDRTGKSPNPIEDVNMQGKGVGRFPLPPGEELKPGVVDVYKAAIRSKNAGDVTPIVP